MYIQSVFETNSDHILEGLLAEVAVGTNRLIVLAHVRTAHHPNSLSTQWQHNFSVCVQQRGTAAQLFRLHAAACCGSRVIRVMLPQACVQGAYGTSHGRTIYAQNRLPSDAI